jgi:hypothetical protein
MLVVDATCPLDLDAPINTALVEVEDILWKYYLWDLFQIKLSLLSFFEIFFEVLM